LGEDVVSENNPLRDVFDAIADPTRRRLIRLLAEAEAGERPLHELTDQFQMGRTAVSKHLAILKEAGLVLDRRVGRETLYRLNASPLQEVQDWVAFYSEFWSSNMLRRARAPYEFQFIGNNEIKGEMEMSYIVDFKNVSTVGLESSPVAEALAGLRANEARYFMTKYKHEFTVVPASESQDTLDYVNRILKEGRDIEFSAKPLETSRFQVENIKFAYVFYEDGLAVNVMYTVDDPKKRAVGFKLSEGMEVPKELEEKFKFARQKSKLAGTIRGSFFVIKKEY
jgi:DNA-binding transcriptional ArsR family regulator